MQLFSRKTYLYDFQDLLTIKFSKIFEIEMDQCAFFVGRDCGVKIAIAPSMFGSISVNL